MAFEPRYEKGQLVTCRYNHQTSHAQDKMKPFYIPRNKYRAVKVKVGDITLDSKREARRWQELQLLERAGEIRSLERQVELPFVFQDGTEIKTPTGRTMKHVIDFAYFQGNERVYEDAKGFDHQVGQIKRAIVEAIYGVKVRLV